MHYILSAEKAYLQGVRFLVRWHGGAGAMRHPREMGASEVEAFLTMLANERRVSASTHNQALSSLLFLYRQVLAMNLPWLDGVTRPAQKRSIPSVLTKDEVAAVFSSSRQTCACWRASYLLYGTGMRLMEG
ncbi:MAG: integrase [Rhodoferax sp.]|nr:integrase [Rhodoferax sp.]